MNQAQKAFDQTAEPVLKSVREGAEYKTAKDKANRAEAAIKQTRAEMYAKTLGMKVRRIVSINEGGGFSPPMPIPLCWPSV